jgi:hypothetical protein
MQIALAPCFSEEEEEEDDIAASPDPGSTYSLFEGEA